MKQHLLPLLICCGLWTTQARAQENQPTINEDSTFLLGTDSQYQWLFEILFPAEIRNQFPDRSFKSFRVHLKDSYKNFIKPELIQKNNLKPAGLETGSMTYVGIFPRGYKYNVSMDDQGAVTIQVKLHLKNPQGSDLDQFRAKVQEAEDIWNRSRSLFPTDFDYQFKFLITENESEAYFSVDILDSTRGPYDTHWGRNWTERNISHEIGHMLGLGDEYKTLSSQSDCLDASLMCQSWTGELMPHHYYFILRRLITVN